MTTLLTHLRVHLGAWWAGDRIQKHAIVEAKVMGQGAVLFTATTLSWAAIFQAAIAAGSNALNSFGQRPIDLTWGITLVLAAAFCWRAWFTRTSDQEEAIRAELAGILLMEAALAVLSVVVVIELGWMGTLVYLALILNPIVNTLGRARMLVDRWRTVRKALQ